MILSRSLQLLPLLKKKSFFLFGPRSTGKSFLVKHQLGSRSVKIDLLSSDTFFRLSAHPEDLEAIIQGALLEKEGGFNKKKGKQKGKMKATSPFLIVAIDEIQKIPFLLNEVHRLIEEKKTWHFLLTGSSARRIKRGQANLLAGRAWSANLFPLTWPEIPDFDLKKHLLYGGLPHVYLSAHPREELKAYTQNYLLEEIQGEGLVRKLSPFSRFLEMAAFRNGEILNFSHLSSEQGIPASSIREYYLILEDTLIGFLLPAWRHSFKRKPIHRAKFYFFDTGVVNTLQGIKSLEPRSDLFGKNFEHWIALEIRAWLSYKRREEIFCYWRSKSNYEVDFILGDHTAIEVKSTKRVSTKDLRGLLALKEEKNWKRLVLVSMDPLPSVRSGIHCLHYEKFLKRLWEEEKI